MIAIWILFALPPVAYILWYVYAVLFSSVARRKWRYPSNLQYPVGKTAFLYPTCDDFNGSACATLLRQEDIEFDLFILDDSTQDSERRRIDDWVREQNDDIQVIRRPNRSGYKGGNINHWLKRFGDPVVYSYMLVVDADEHIPADFARQLIGYIESGRYAFAQGCHLGTVKLHTVFQKLLHAQVECLWFHQIPSRNFSGFPPMLGHGVLLRTESLLTVGGFPDLVSEDLALTILLAKENLAGIIAPSVVGYEEYPRNYRPFWNRLRRWIQADVEVVRKMLGMLWKNPIGWQARLILSMRELRLPLVSVYWGLLCIIALTGFSVYESPIRLSPLVWGVFPLFLTPALPALSIKRFSFIKRILYISSVAFVGAATLPLHPIALLKGILGERHFSPTGSAQTHRQFTLPIFLFSELFTAFVFITGGLLASNWLLVAVGIAIGCSPLMRSRWETQTLVVGAALFWFFILYQIGIDVTNGFLPVEHLLVLVGLPMLL